MFLNEISEYSNKKLKTLYGLFISLYFTFMLVAPSIIIIREYEIFKKSGVASLTGLGVLMVLVFTVIGLKSLKTKITQFPENTLEQRRVKFTCQLVYSLILPGIAVAILIAFNLNYETAFSVLKNSLIFYVLSVFIDNLFLKYIESERKLRFEAQKALEVNKRVKFFK